MPPARGTKRKSNQVTMSDDESTTRNAASQIVPTKTGTPSRDESPLKKRKLNFTVMQKQALVDNLQLEITERARKLRATYNIHAQSLRTRIEIRVNRIPLSLRKVKLGDLVQKYADQQQRTQKAAAKGPPVPEKDINHGRPALRKPPVTYPGSPMRAAKRMSHEMTGGDKENDVEGLDMPKKKARPGQATAEISRNPGQVLSPASSNSRIAPRERPAASPVKSSIARPVSPTKMATATNMISNMVGKARTRAKTTASTTASSFSATTTTASKPRRTIGQPAAPPSRPPTRTTRRVSGISESSDGSTSTVVRKRPATAMATTRAPAAAKRSVMGTIKKGVAATATKKAPAAVAKPTAASTAGTGRVLRKRG
ncbi:Borealin N terminal-domain-containing protein [Schizothecium vesticola]|uniref:Borealin N terminal-domain-containing protein n=1 Tax=Schizothecium vesticola TaxID=314040 RepID=A0AA40F5N6_9PEZI|nr:Borealin N terminal-domain-containing protein [Schizothecium vesticola]